MANRIGVIGSRNFRDFDLLCDVLSGYDPKVIVSGGAQGADKLAEEWARKNNIDTLIFKPDWEKFGRSAGFVRNKDIVENSDILIAFWDGKSKGTANSIDLAKKMGKIVRVVRFDKHKNVFNYGVEDDMTSNSSLRIIWQDQALNFSKEKQRLLTAYFKNKYKINNVNVIPDIVGEDNKTSIQIDNVVNIFDIAYQRQLFKDWLLNNKIAINFDHIVKLDNRVNEILKQGKDFEEQFKKWEIKKIEFSNFLSFGGNQVMDYTKKKGLTIVSSDPPNQGGKTVLTVDLLLFLFFNTTTKTSKVKDIFNLYANSDEVRVKGYLNIDDSDYIIERVLKRKQKNDDWVVTQELNFFKQLPTGEFEDLKGEQRRETELIIESAIGNVEDFLLTIVATNANLENLIETKPTERGNILSRFLGLEILREKEDIAKGLYNDWKGKLKSNLYDVDNLITDIEEKENKIKELTTNSVVLTDTINDINKNIVSMSKERDILLSTRHNIDPNLTNLNLTEINRDVADLNKDKNNKLTRLSELNKTIDSINVDYDVDVHNKISNYSHELNLLISECDFKIKDVSETIDALKSGEICPKCKRPLDGINHGDEIDVNQRKLDALLLNRKHIESKKIKTIERLEEELKNKILYEEKERSTIIKEKTEIDIENLDLKLDILTTKLVQYSENKKHIEDNKMLDKLIFDFDYKINNGGKDLLTKQSELQRCLFEIDNISNDINDRRELIKELKKEQSISKVFETYIMMLGKNGISKIVMRNVIPLINFELEKLLSEVVNFSVDLQINDKNEIDFWMSDANARKLLSAGSGYERVVGSLALRCVLSKISCLPNPSLIVMDEIFGKVANENLEQIAYMLDKIKEYFTYVFMITHNPLSKEWGDHIIMVTKKDHISNIA